MDTFVSIFLIGISFGVILFLLGAGLSLTMGLMRIVNLAHGALYMFGAYAGYAAAKATGNFAVGLLVAAISAGLIGLLMEIGFLRRLYKQEASQVLLTIGFVYIITNVIQWVWGAYPFSGITPGFLSGYIPMGNITFPVYRLATIGFGVLMAVLLWLFQEKTRVGAIVRAGMDNREVTAALGINLKVVFTGIFALGALVAGLCGLVGAPMMGINLQVGWDTLLLAMIVVIVGGTGSIQGALLGGLVIGLLDSFGKAYFPQFAYFLIYVVLIIILLFKPSGLLGRAISLQKTSEQQSVPGSAKKGNTANQLKLAANHATNWQSKLHTFVPYLGVVLLLVVLPPLLSTYYVSILTKVLIFAIFAFSLDLVLGYTGLLSLGHAAFLGVAGYALGLLSIKLGINLFWIVVPLCILVSAAVAAIIGYISLRVSGVYFLLVTMAFGQLLSVVATKWSSVTGGTDGLVGIIRPNLGISGFTWTSINFYYLVFFVMVICYLLLHRIVNSSFGRALVGIRENEMRMRSLGYNTWALKYVAVIIAGAFAGVGGVFFAYFYGAMVPSNLALEMSASVMLMVIIGGPGTLFGPFIGSAIVVLIERFASIYVPERWPLILGAIFIVCVMLVRGGFARYFSRFWRGVKFERNTKLDNLGERQDETWKS
jgi:branched-chain amino acid transport system permease protein